MKKVFSFFVLFLLVFCSKAEEISGIVYDKHGNKPIGFVSIGIINSPFGTYSNENGQFKLKLDKFNKSDTLRFSCIGYNSISINVAEFFDKYSIGDTVFLSEKITQLNEIVVLGNRIETKTLGNKNASRQVLIGFLGDKESGIIVKNEENILLREVAFKLAMTEFDQPDSAVFRFNIYSLKNGLPDRNLLKKPIYFRIYNGQFDETVSFNIRAENIKLEDKFAATFELVKQYGGKRIYFAGKLRGCKGITRWGPQGEWIEQKADGGPLKLHQSLEIGVIKIE